MIQTLTLHWNGTKWAQVPSPDVGASANSLNGVATASASSARAVGSYTTPGGDNTLILRWGGTRWVQVPSPTPGGTEAGLNGVTASSTSNFWAAGFFSGGTDAALTLHCC